MQVDNTINLSIVVALCAIISPVLTTIINVVFQYRMKKLEIEEKFKDNNTYLIIKALETYSSKIGRCISTDKHPLDLKDYGEAYTLALMYLPDDVIPKAKELHQLLLCRNLVLASPIAEEIVIMLRKEIQRLRKQLL